MRWTWISTRGWVHHMPHARRWPRPVVLWTLCMVQLGCAFATLDSVVKQNRLATTEEIQHVQIVRQSQRLLTQLPMNLQQGDEITTDAETTVVIKFATGTEVILWPNTRVRIFSIRALLGELYVKARGFFRVETDYVVAGTEGTEFLTTVGHHDEVSIIVVEGIVKLESKLQRWSPISLRQSEQAIISGQGAPQRRTVAQGRLDEIRRRVATIEQLTPEPPPEEPLRLPFRPELPSQPRDSGGRGGRGGDTPGKPGGGGGSRTPQ